MQNDDVAIRAQVQDGVWETFGVDRAISVVPESVVASSNEYGNDKASFDLRRSPAAIWPDLQAFTPIEVEVAGEVVWSGRITETPATDGDDPVINVQCEGWQYHLDDDVYAQSYVHTRLSDWKDIRSFSDTSLPTWPQRLLVNARDGIITIGAASGTVWPTSTGVGVTLDLGPYALARRVVAQVNNTIGGGNAGVFVYMRGSNTPDPFNATTHPDIITGAAVTGYSTTPTYISGTLSAGQRYVSIFLFSGPAYTAGTDDTFDIRSVQVFADPTYEASNASALKASTVIKDALTPAPLLNPDQSQVAATTFNIPDLHFERDPKTPREVIDAVNAFHNYNTWVDVDGRMNFQPRPSAPIYEVGPWGGSQFQDSAMNSGQDVYNRALVTGIGPDGESMIVESTAGAQPGVAVRASSAVSPANPSFAVDASGWGGGVTRDTTVFDTSPASGKLTGTTTAVGTLNGTFKKGATYVLRGALYRPVYDRHQALVRFGYPTSGSDYGLAQFDLPAGVWVPFSLAWTPRTDYVGTALIHVQGNVSPTIVTNIDSFAIYVAAPTMVDRRGFKRTKILPVSASLTTGVGKQLGGVFLQTHGTQPLKGALTTQISGIRRHLTGEDVHPSHILRSPGQNVRLSHRVDPDTGGQGRDGRIASVTYTHAERTAQIELDNDRRNFEALLARYSAIAGTRVQS